MRYAQNTTVPVEKSKAEIERMLTRYNASKFAVGWGDGGAVLVFEVRGIRIRFNLPLPARDAKEFKLTPTTRRPLSAEASAKLWEQACRQRWRALALVIKAKLEAVECGVSIFEKEFLSHIVLPGGETIGDAIVPRLDQLYTGKPLPPMLGIGT